MLKRRHFILFFHYFNMFKWTSCQIKIKPINRSKEPNQLNIFQIKKSLLSNTFYVLSINDWSIDWVHQPCNLWINLEFQIWHVKRTSPKQEKPTLLGQNSVWLWRNQLKFIFWMEKPIERTGTFVFDNLYHKKFSGNEHIN